MLLPLIHLQPALGFYQELLDNCFYNNVTATYNPTLLQLTVQLYPTNAFLCRAFPSGLMVTVKAYEVGTNILAVVDGFDYEASREIVLNGVDFSGIRPSYIQLNISSVSHYTMVDVFTLRWELSRFQGCFEEDVTYQVLEDELRLTVRGTGACYQMQYLTRIEVVDGSYFNSMYVSEESVTFVDGVSRQSIDSVTHLFEHYGPGVELVFVQSGSFLSELQNILKTPVVTFWMKTPGGLEIDSVVVPRLKICGDSRHFLTQSSVFQMDNSIGVNFLVNESLLQAYSTAIGQSDEVIYRLSVLYETGNDSTIYTMQQAKTKYEAETKIMLFTCNEADAGCKTAMLNAVQAETPKYQFDITFLKNATFQLFFAAIIPRFETCWSSGVVFLRGRSEFCYDLRVKHTATQCAFYTAQEATVYFQIVSVTLREVVEFYTTKKDTVSLQKHTYCYDCGSNKSCIQRFKQALNKEEKFFLFNATTTTSWAGLPVIDVIRGNYTTTTITVCVVGVVLVAFSIVYTAYQMRLVRLQIKQLRSGMKAGAPKDRDD